MKTIRVFMLFGLISVVAPALAQNYNEMFAEAVKKAVGKPLRKYQIFSYPIDNFGVLTLYEKKVDPGNQLIDMLSFTEADGDSEEQWLNLNGYVSIASGGPIVLEQQVQDGWGAEVILPKILGVIGISTSGAKESMTGIKISIPKVFIRVMEREKVMKYLNSLDKKDLKYRAYINKRLVYIVSDCVLDGLSVEISRASSLKSELDAKIGASENGMISRVFKDASVSVNVNRSVEGNYSLKFDRPLIFATLAKKQPAAGELGAIDNYDDWEDVPNIDVSKAYWQLNSK